MRIVSPRDEKLYNNPFGIEIRATYSDMLTDIQEDYDINESCYVFGAVQYWGTTSSPELGERQKGLGARIGMGFGF